MAYIGIFPSTEKQNKNFGAPKGSAAYEIKSQMERGSIFGGQDDSKRKDSLRLQYQQELK